MASETLEQLAWLERLARRHHAAILTDPVVREFDRELKRAVADADTLDGRLGAIRAGQDRLAEHFGLGPRPR
jgi:hypothetical protein